MIDFNRITELLDKDSLTAEEKNILNNIFIKDPEVKEFSRVYLSLKTSLKRNGHIGEELMGEYILYKNNISKDRSVMLLSGIVEDHIRRCSECEFLFKEFNSEYAEVDNFVDRSISHETIFTKSPIPKNIPLLKRTAAVKYAFAALAAVIIIYIGLLSVSSLTSPAYKSSLMNDEDFYATRGRTSELFQRGLNAIENKNYDSAVQYLNEDAAKNSEDESIFYTYFVLGITYASKSESDFLGLFQSFDKDDVKKAIASFEKSLALNTSGRFDNLKLDTHYFIGKSYLMIDETGKAEKHLRMVVDGKGSYYRNAEELLDKL